MDNAARARARSRLIETINEISLGSEVPARLFALDTNSSSGLLEAAEALVTLEELTQSRRFRMREQRERFVLRRAARRALAMELELAPNGEMRVNEQGQPIVPKGWAGVSFSSTHGLALFAFSRSHSIGVDVERIRVHRDAKFVAQYYFSARERDALAAGAADFLTIWTLKEAWVKAIGSGLVDDLSRYCVASLAKGTGAPAELALDHLLPLQLGPTHVGAIAILRTDPRTIGAQQQSGR